MKIVSFDGKEFKTVEECLAYEASTIPCFGVDGKKVPYTVDGMVGDTSNGAREIIAVQVRSDDDLSTLRKQCLTYVDGITGVGLWYWCKYGDKDGDIIGWILLDKRIEQVKRELDVLETIDTEAYYK